MNAVPELDNVVDLNADRRAQFEPPIPLQPQSDVSRLLNMLRRRAGLIAAVVATTMVLVLVVVFQMTPIYRGDTLIQLETRETNVIDIEGVLSGVSTDLHSVRTEGQVIASRHTIGRVIDEMALAKRPEFNPRIQGIGPFLYVWDLVRTLFTGESFRERMERLTPKGERALVIDTVRASISAEPLNRTRVINVSAYSRSPEVAAALANSVADAYLEQQLEAKFEATERATLWLNNRLLEMRDRLDASEQAVADYRMTAGLAKAETASVTAERVTRVNSQLIEARAERAEAVARLRQVQALLDAGQGASSIAEVLNSPLIQQLRNQEAEVLRRASELSSRYGPEHPRMIDTRAEVSDIAAKIEIEVQRIVVGLRNEVQVARARENAIAANMSQLEQKLASLQGAEVKLDALEREAETNRTLYETLPHAFPRDQ